MPYAEVHIPIELGAEVNIRCRSPQVGAEVIRAEHRTVSTRWKQNFSKPNGKHHKRAGSIMHFEFTSHRYSTLPKTLSDAFKIH